MPLVPVQFDRQAPVVFALDNKVDPPSAYANLRRDAVAERCQPQEHIALESGLALINEFANRMLGPRHGILEVADDLQPEILWVPERLLRDRPEEVHAIAGTTQRNIEPLLKDLGS